MIPPKEKLLYHWSTEDDEIDSIKDRVWVDRIQGFPLTAVRDRKPRIDTATGGKYYLCGGTPNRDGFTFDANNTEAGNGTTGIRLGRCWRIVIDCKPTLIGDNKVRCFVCDFTCIRVGRNGFAFGFNKDITDLEDEFDIGGDSEFGAKSDTTQIDGVALGNRITIEYGCKVKNGRYYQYLKMGDKEKTALVPHHRFVFDGIFQNAENAVNITWPSKSYIGQVYGNTSTLVSVNIYDVKIYGTQDYE